MSKILSARDLIAGDDPISLVDSLEQNNPEVCIYYLESIRFINLSARQVREYITLFPAKADEAFRIHNRNIRRFAKTMAAKCGLKFCPHCEKYFVSAHPLDRICCCCVDELMEDING